MNAPGRAVKAIAATHRHLLAERPLEKSLFPVTTQGREDEEPSGCLLKCLMGPATLTTPSSPVSAEPL